VDVPIAFALAVFCYASRCGVELGVIGRVRDLLAGPIDIGDGFIMGRHERVESPRETQRLSYICGAVGSRSGFLPDLKTQLS
jgi:hypothetical protein